LAADTNRLFACLEKSGFIQHQNTGRIAEPFDHIVAADVTNPFGIPKTASENRLHPPRRFIPRMLGQLPTGLAFNRADQPIQIKTDLTACFRSKKHRGYAGFQTREVFRPRQG
jgi:hypothetical protein